MTWCFCQTNTSRNNCIVNCLVQIISYIFNYLHGQICSSIIHRKYNTINRKFWIQSIFYKIDCINKLAQSLQCIVFTLNRNQYRICRCHRVNCQCIQRWWTINDNKIISIFYFRNNIAKNIVSIFHIHCLDFNTSQIYVSR